MKPLILVSEEEAEKYLNVAKNFLKQHTMYADGHFAAKTAIAEYLASLDGKTLYISMVGKELKD